MKQINVKTAHRLFESGKEVFLQSSNMRFESVWCNAMPLKKETAFTDDWEYIVADFAYYNCDNERGKYIHYFVRLSDYTK